MRTPLRIGLAALLLVCLLASPLLLAGRVVRPPTPSGPSFEQLAELLRGRRAPDREELLSWAERVSGRAR